jgi:hypothetical protein
VTRLSVRDTDPRFARTRGRIETRFSCLLGVQGKDATAKHKGAPLTVVEIANQHEFGLGVPERSWLRAWFDENEAMIRNDLRRAAMRIIEGRLTQVQAAELLGAKYVAAIQTRIANGIAPPNAQVTIDRKKSSTPLIDTGQFRSAITSIMEELITGQAYSEINGGVTSE